MFEVIKGSSPVNTIVIDGDVKIAISSFKKSVKEEQSKRSDNEENVKSEEGQADSNVITMTQEELDSLRAQYRMDGEQYAEEMRLKTEMEFARAKVQADKIVEDAESKVSEMMTSAEERISKAAEEGRKQGYDDAYKEGYGKGTEDGYTHAIREGREAIQDLQNLCKAIEKEKNELMAENRRAIFDLSMEIAQKVTMTMLNQKDKSVLQRMIANAAKEFRKAKRVKVTVSRLDLSDEVETDLKTFEKCFSSSAEVEFEVLEDGEKGTLQIETDTEILDAGVSTQLKMIEELGSGKYRDKEPEKSSEADEDNDFEAIDETVEEKAEVKTEAKTEDKVKEKRRRKAKTEEKSEEANLQINGEVPVTEDEDAE